MKFYTFLKIILDLEEIFSYKISILVTATSIEISSQADV